MEPVVRWELSGDQAETYEQYFVPAIFAQWASQVAAVAQIDYGHRVLDIGCGTGILARKALEETGQQGHVTGLDRLDSMLEVARRLAPEIEWRQGDAEALPFRDASFDRVVSQFALMFMKSRVTAVREMWRVLRPGGRMVFATWAPLGHSPGYGKLVALTRQFAGSKAADVIAAPFSLGREHILQSMLRAAGLPKFRIEHRKGTAKFPTVETLLDAEIKGTSAIEHMNEHQFGTILHAARKAFEPMRIATGEIVLSLDANLVIADKVD